jgi:hypothetical protein
MFSRTGVTMLLRQFGETVTYRPRCGGSAREITAIVNREPYQVLPEDGDTTLPLWQVQVADSTSDGIGLSELNVGGDQIALPPRTGDTEVRKTILRIVNQANGMLVLECR